jgi:galactose mutarotase-like enzyme
MQDWTPVTLENERLRVTVLPERGGDIHALRHLPSQSELLWRAPWETPAGPSIPAGVDFHDWYLGGWNDLFPNGDGPCVVDGVSHERHGESWRMPWRASGGGDALTLEVELSVLPLRARKTLRLSGSTLVVDELVEHVGDAPLRMMWGQHPAWGGDLLEAGCRIDLPGAMVEGYGAQVDATSRLDASARAPWPTFPGSDGGELDLSVVPGPERRSHDVAVIGDLADGWYALRNPGRGIGVALRFPRELFRWLWMWQPFGGVSVAPFDQGTYALALEPWTSPPGLERATARGAEVRLQPGETLSATIEATVFEAGEGEVTAVGAGGRVETTAVSAGS